MMGKLLVAAALLLGATGGALAGSGDDGHQIVLVAGGQGRIEQIGDHDGIRNSATLSITGSGNSVSLYQEMKPLDAPLGNTASITINGNGNGGGLGGGSLFTGALTSDALSRQPLKAGHVSQIGTANQLTLSVTGDNNLFAFLQDGAGNVLTGSINGSLNQVAAMQLGAGNVMSFSQVGRGNMLSVTQISR